MRDISGGLRVACNIASAAGTCDFITGQFALRINDLGRTQELLNSGWVFLSDNADNLWLGNIRGGKKGGFNIWRDSKFVDMVDVPTADGYTMDLFSDKKGSVYIRTIAGLYHLTSSIESDYSDYHVDRMYSIANLPGNIMKMAYSDLGYFVTNTFSNEEPRKYYINLIYKP